MHLTRSPRYDRRQALQLTAMVEVPREPEAVRGEVEVPDLVGEHGGVALLPRRDGQVVARRVVAQRDVLHPGQFLCENFRSFWLAQNKFCEVEVAETYLPKAGTRPRVRFSRNSSFCSKLSFILAGRARFILVLDQ